MKNININMNIKYESPAWLWASDNIYEENSRSRLNGSREQRAAFNRISEQIMM